MMKYYKKGQSGFTLIELLVVIAIIGLLAAVVLASLGTARSKGVDAAVKSQLDGARAQAELFASNNNNAYSGVCAALSSAQGLASIGASAVTQSGKAGAYTTTLATAGAWNNVTCHDTASGWAMEAPLSASVSATPLMWCVDSNGASKVETSPTSLAASSITCV